MNPVIEHRKLRKAALFLLSTLVILFVFAPQRCAASDQIRISAALDTTEYLIGDYIPVRIEVAHSPDIIVFPPDPGEKAGKLEVIELIQFEPARAGEEIIDNFTLNLAAYDTGNFTIPPLTINYHSRGDTVISSIAADSLFLTVKFAGGDTLSGIHDIKPPANLPREFADYLPYIILLALLAVAALTYWRWKRRKLRPREIEESAVAAEFIDPYRRAMKRLTELEAAAPWKKGFVKEYYSEATEIFREYIEGEFEIPALEMTTEELLDEISVNNIVDLHRAKEYLQDADLVKFAKYIPDAENCQRLIDQTYKLLKEARDNALKRQPPDSGIDETEREGSMETVPAENGAGEGSQ